MKSLESECCGADWVGHLIEDKAQCCIVGTCAKCRKPALFVPPVAHGVSQPVLYEYEKMKRRQCSND